jgi:hypothetical protein
MGIGKIVFDGVGWINLAQYRDPLRDLLKTVMNLRVPEKMEIS